MRILYMTVGFLGSGKSTWVKNFAKDHPKTKIVSSDDLRKMLNGDYKYVPELDALLDKVMEHMIRELFYRGYDVIVDACNLTKKRRDTWFGTKVKKRVAVIFMKKTKKEHIENRMKSPHCESENLEYWSNIYDSQNKQFEPVLKGEMDDMIYVK